MLDENLQTGQKEAQVYEAIPADVYQVELLDITSSQVESYRSKQGETEGKEFETVLSFQFVLLDGEHRLRSVWNNYIPNFLYISKKTGKNKLFKIVEALIGRELNQSEMVGMGGKFLNSLIGKQCRVVIENTTKGDKTYSNPVNWMKANAEIASLTVEEKDKCKVKPKAGSSALDESGQELPSNDQNEIRVEDLPF